MRRFPNRLKLSVLSSIVVVVATCSGSTVRRGSTVRADGRTPPSIVDNIAVDPTIVLSDTARHPIGINTDWIDDNQAWRPAGSSTLQTALAKLGVRYLRYPGGEEGNLYLWSVPPYTASVSTLALPGPDRSYNKTPYVVNSTTPVNAYDFDQFMADCKAIHCTPNIMVTLRPYLASKMANDPVPSRQRLIDSAAAWVRYANITKKYGIKQWEIGNEYQINNSGPSHEGTGPSETIGQYIQDVKDFSTAMKAVDPSIEIGAFGGWMKSEYLPILQADASYIDFLIVHPYPFGMTASQQTTAAQYQSMTTIQGVESAINAALSALADPSISSADRARIKLSVTETNSTLRGDTNNLFDAIALTDILGQILTHPQVNYVEVWTDHWYPSLTPHPDGFNILDNSNRITAKGSAIEVWGKFLSGQMVQGQVTSTDSMVRAYATYDQHTGELNVILLNKDSSAHAAKVSLKNYTPNFGSMAARTVLSGKGPRDTSPSFSPGNDVAIKNGAVSVMIAGPSVVVLTLEGVDTNGLNLIADPGFEDRDLSAWIKTSTPTLIPVSHSGMQAVRLPPGSRLAQSLSLPASQTCTLGAWGSLSSPGAGQASVVLSGMANGRPWNRSLNVAAASYTYLSQKFTVPDRLTDAHISLSNGAAGDLMLDDLSLNCR